MQITNKYQLSPTNPCDTLHRSICAANKGMINL